MGIQGLCSSLGGVYFQWLLQNPSAGNIGLWEKNIYLCGFSIALNVAIVTAWQPDFFTPQTFARNLSWPVLSIVATSAMGGVSTSLLLQHLDVVMKEYANFGLMVVVALAQNHIFDTQLRGSLFIAIVMVSYSLYL